MNYYFSKVLSNISFENAIELVTASLKTEGFGIITTIDVKDTFQKKLEVDFRKYTILGACNPKFAHKAISSEPKIGVFLPCNVIVEENEDGGIEVSAVDPVASMMAVNNPDLADISLEIRKKLQLVIENLNPS